MPVHPTGLKWRREAVAWWDDAIASPSSALWVDSDRELLEQLVWMVDRWWRLTRSNPSEAMRMADNVRRAAETLYLTPKARAAAGVVVEQRRPAAPAEGNARARLHALPSRGGPGAVDAG